MELISFAIIIFGAITGILLTIKTLTLVRSLTGSFFKKSYRFAALGSLFLSLGFIAEAINWMGFNQPELLDIIHHVLLFASGIFFFSVAIVFPKEIKVALEGK